MVKSLFKLEKLFIMRIGCLPSPYQEDGQFCARLLFILLFYDDEEC